MSKKKDEPPPTPPRQPLNLRAWELIRKTVQHYLDNPTLDGSVEQTAFLNVPEEVRGQIESVLNSYQGARKSYRIAMIGQFAYGLESESPLDLTQRQPGSRGDTGLGGKVGTLLAENHIISVADAYQNVAKNTDNMARGNFAEFDASLRWANGAAKDSLRAAFPFACFHIARTSRPVRPLPEIDQSKLKFASVMTLFNTMLTVPSGGAHQQFITAALLEAKEEQSGTGRYVETKNINTTDQSARTAADVQIKTGTKVDEAFEVTANDWSEKVDGAAMKIRAYDLSRLHIVAGVADHAQMLKALAARPEDVSVLELTGFFATLVAELRKAGRAAALKRLYELLDRHQPDTELVNGYVLLMVTQGLTVPTS
jgi:hypothetical protein